MYRNFGPNRRPLTAREKSIRFQYGALFVFSALCAITLGVLYNNKNIELEKTQKLITGLDSTYANLDYHSFRYGKDSSIIYYKLDYDENPAGDTIDIEIPNSEKLERISTDAKSYREIADPLFELNVNEGRYAGALDAYSDPLMHQEYRERTGTSFKSKYTEAQRKEIVEKIKKEVSSFNSIIAYRDAFDWYREIDPVAIKEIELFFYFTE